MEPAGKEMWHGRVPGPAWQSRAQGGPGTEQQELECLHTILDLFSHPVIPCYLTCSHRCLQL